MITKICKNCGKEFQTDDKRRKFCSRTCSGKYNNTGKKHTEEEKIKISHSLQRRNPNFDGTYHDREPRQKENYLKFDKTREYFCLNCGEKITVKYGSKANKFCNGKCQREYDYKEYIRKWKNGEVTGVIGKYDMSGWVRRYMFTKAQNKCEKCGFEGTNPYTNRTILQIHHIDGNCLNNTEENLQVLCPNCHAMTENFGSRNKSATPGRSKYFGKAN